MQSIAIANPLFIDLIHQWVVVVVGVGVVVVVGVEVVVVVSVGQVVVVLVGVVLVEVTVLNNRSKAKKRLRYGE